MQTRLLPIIEGRRFGRMNQWLCDTCLTLVKENVVVWAKGLPYCRECAQWTLCVPPILAVLPVKKEVAHV